MIWKVLLKKENLIKFLDSMNKNVDFNIMKMYVFDDEVEIFHYDYYGYAEPLMFYEDNKHLIKDVWWLPITDTNNLVGRNMRDIWYSAKKEYEEDFNAD